MNPSLPIELELFDLSWISRFSGGRSFLIPFAAGPLPEAKVAAPVFVPVTAERTIETIRAGGFLPEILAERLREGIAALSCGPVRLVFDPADPPVDLDRFVLAGGHLRLDAQDVHTPLAFLAARSVSPEQVTLCAANLPGPESGALLAAAYLCGAALLSYPGIAISLPGNGPVSSWGAALETLASCGVPVPGVTLVSCPTCARTSLDIFSLAERIHARTRSVTTPLRVAVMGCEVNGPGEARDCDLGVAGGRDRGLLFRHGESLHTVPPGELESALIALIEEETGERCLPPAPERETGRIVGKEKVP